MASPFHSIPFHSREEEKMMAMDAERTLEGGRQCQADGWTDGWIGRQVDGQMDRWTSGQVDGRMD